MFLMEDNPHVQVRMSCFTTTPDNFLMWGHYADKSSGICIEYDVSSAEKEASIFWKVAYENDIDMLAWATHKLEYRSMIPFLSLKHKNWEYENEYRYIALCEGNNLEEDSFAFKVFAPIKSIYLGANIKNDLLYGWLFTIAKEKNIPIYQFVPNSRKTFSLDKYKI